MDSIKHIVQINIVLGAWLIVAPFVLGYSAARPYMVNDVVLGAVLIACASWILAGLPFSEFGQWVQMVASLWLIAAPFALHYGRFSPPYTNDLIVGILALAASVAATWMLAARAQTPA